MENWVIFGTGADPFGVHHLQIVKVLSEYSDKFTFDKVMVVPCGGIREDKPQLKYRLPVHRAAILDLYGRYLPEKAEIDLFDLEHDRPYSRTYELVQRYRAKGRRNWIFVGGDIVKQIQTLWKKRQDMWGKEHFLVLTRPGYELDPKDLPPKSILIEADLKGSSKEVRERRMRNESITGLLIPEAEDYILRHQMYTGAATGDCIWWGFDHPRPLIIADYHNPKAMKFAAAMAKYEDKRNPNLVLVAGGDSTMMRIIRQEWRRRLPFFGVNFGTFGFMMSHNSRQQLLAGDFSVLKEVKIRQSPLLYIETVSSDGEKKATTAVNDVWIQNGSTKRLIPIRFQVRVKGSVSFWKRNLIGDGALVATSLGSTGKAITCGANPTIMGSPSIQLLGLGIRQPLGALAPRPLPFDCEIIMKPIKGNRTPVIAVADGSSLGEIAEMRVRVSRIAAPEICFLPEEDHPIKVARWLG